MWMLMVGSSFWSIGLLSPLPFSMIMLESHPYPGTFPLQSNGPDILRQVRMT